MITVTHYLDSLLFEGIKEMNWIKEEGMFESELEVAIEYGLVNGNDKIIASEPIIAMLTLFFITSITLILGARGIARKQF